MSNAKTVQEIYAAFGRGDIPAILSRLSPDVDWEYGQQGKTGVPWLQPRKGRDAVGGFFESLGALDFQKFQPKEIIEGPNVVIALIDIDLKVKSNGNPIVEEDEIHLWRFNDRGEVVRFRHGSDTHAHQAAYKG